MSERKNLTTLLGDLAGELKELFNKKKAELSEGAGINDSYLQGQFINRQRDIEGFEASIKKINNDPTLYQDIIDGFTKDYEQIKKDIEAIK